MNKPNFFIKRKDFQIDYRQNSTYGVFRGILKMHWFKTTKNKGGQRLIRQMETMRRAGTAILMSK